MSFVAPSAGSHEDTVRGPDLVGFHSTLLDLKELKRILLCKSRIKNFEELKRILLFKSLF
jgi:hypothetical protein